MIATNNFTTDPISLTVRLEEELTLFEMNGKMFIAKPQFVKNLKHQKSLVEKSIVYGKDLIGNTYYLIGDTYNYAATMVETKYDSKNDTSGINIIFDKTDIHGTYQIKPYEFKYYEPESLVVSRSGDICIVAIIDQWFIDYGDENITKIINEYINSKDFHANNKLKNMLLGSSEWIKEWACSRTNGLGTRLLDTKFIIDSLSDSTIYMAYYTISHKIEQIPIDILKLNSYEIFEYIFKDGIIPKLDTSYESLLTELKNEFQYWYPLDLRVSGKDLINNHLTMCLYTHAMIWKNKNILPKSYVVNGHLLLNGQKMSKSEGIFMTMKDAVEKYGADAVRLTLAEAGSDMNDANFVEQNANSAILKLATEKDWCIEMINLLCNSLEVHVLTFWDEIFEQEIFQCIIETEEFYSQLEYQKAIVNGFYKMLSIRDNLRLKYESNLIPFSNKSMKLYIEAFLLITYPICPHFVENIWAYASDKNITLNEVWNFNIKINNNLIFTRDIILNTLSTIRSDIASKIKKQNKNKVKQDKFDVTITIFNCLIDSEINTIQTVRDMYIDELSWEKIYETFAKNSDKSIMKLLSAIQKGVQKYGVDWFEFPNNLTNLCKVFEEWIPKLCTDKNINTIQIIIEQKQKEMDLYKSVVRIK